MKKEIHTFKTAFLPNLASARSSRLSLEFGRETLSSASLLFVEDNAIVSPIQYEIGKREIERMENQLA
jgi:hypothetical protein